MLEESYGRRWLPRRSVITKVTHGRYVVRSKKPATSRRTPSGGAPTTAHTPEEASEPRIDVTHVTDLLLGTWAETRREAAR